jgi:hypothetical protein
MVRKAILSAAAILVAASLIWAAGDPWKSKPYQQWDSKDIQKIFNDSPWSKVLQAGNPLTNGKGGGGDNQEETMNSANRNMVTRPGQDPHGAQSPPSGTQIPTDAPGQWLYVFRWVSSRTIRAAALRKDVLSGQRKDDDIAKQVAAPLDTYQILVAGTYMGAFQGADEAKLKSVTFLQTKKKKEKIAPSEVKIERGPDGKSVQSVVFSFPKKTATGEPTIAPDEKGADFSTSAGGQKIATSFDFSKMEDSQGRDL